MRIWALCRVIKVASSLIIIPTFYSWKQSWVINTILPPCTETAAGSPACLWTRAAHQPQVALYATMAVSQTTPNPFHCIHTQFMVLTCMQFSFFISQKKISLCTFRVVSFCGVYELLSLFYLDGHDVVRYGVSVFVAARTFCHCFRSTTPLAREKKRENG